MDDWQDAAFSSRHMHNRVGGGNKSKRTNPFDVRKTFASYSVKCAAWQKALGDGHSDNSASLELYRLTENGEGVVGELFLPGVLNAAVILAASRESLRRTVSDLETTEEEESSEANDDDDDDEEEEEEEEDGSGRNRFETFEKNSFRSPKFWIRWSGVPSTEGQNGPKSAGTPQSELGYIVFTGNDCRKFKGTLNCTSLKWKDIALTGHKISSRTESDVPVTWSQSGAAI